MKVEILFPELCGLFGDRANMKYLSQCGADAVFAETSTAGEPQFVRSRPDLIYMGPMSERGQQIAADKLRPYAERLKELLEDGVHFLLTGNSFELFGSEIVQDGSAVQGLGILDLRTRCELSRRYNGLFLGLFEGIEIVGFHSRFSHSRAGAGVPGFAKKLRGIGLDPDAEYEGVHLHNLYGTQLLGPLLPLNPLFTKFLLWEITGGDVLLAFEDAAMEAYRRRLAEFKNPKVHLD